MNHYRKVVIFLILLISCYKDPRPIEILEIDNDKIERKALIIGVDGVRSEAISSNSTPFIYNTLSKKNVYFNLSSIVEEHTLSGPNWSSLLTGVHLNKHNVTDNSFNNHNLHQHPPFFKYIEDLTIQKNTVSIVNWQPINDNIISTHVDYSISNINDSNVFNTAKELLINLNPFNPDLVFIHFDELDAVGHQYGFSSLNIEYINQLNILDSYIEELYKLIEEKRSFGEDWIIFIVSDHGGDGTSHYDNNNPHINKTLFISEHPSITFKNNYINNMTDLPISIMTFLGLYNNNFYSNTDGNVIFFEED
tara:strand:- start:3680 stop:4600 length:921 start_codon:yes stop_codon:yes gene_type:complete